jgi:hypothetical protein
MDESKETPDTALRKIQTLARVGVGLRGRPVPGETEVSCVIYNITHLSECLEY